MVHSTIKYNILYCSWSLMVNYIYADKKLTFAGCLSLVDVCCAFLYGVMGAYRMCISLFGHVTGMMLEHLSLLPLAVTLHSL